MFLPWRGGDTSQVQPPAGLDMLGSQNQMVLTRTGDAWTYPPLLGASAPAGRCGGWGKYSHHRTRRSGTGGTASKRENP